MVHHPQRVEPGELGPPGDVAQTLAELCRPARPGEPRDLQPEAQRRGADRHRTKRISGTQRRRHQRGTVGGRPRAIGSARAGTTTWCASNGSASNSSRAAGQSASWRRSTASGTRSARARLRRRTSAAGVSNSTATHGTPTSAAIARHVARRRASVPNESTTVVSRRRSRARTTSSSTANASTDAARSWGPSPTNARSASLDTTCAAEVRRGPRGLPRRRRPDEHHEARGRQLEHRASFAGTGSPRSALPCSLPVGRPAPCRLAVRTSSPVRPS